MIMNVLLFFADNLIPIMIGGIFVALTVRYIAYRSSLNDQMYFKTFSRSVEKMLDAEGKGQKIEDVETWISGLMARVLTHLPERSLRFGGSTPTGSGSETTQTMSFRSRESITQYAEGKRSVILAVRAQTDVFKSPHMPNFADLSKRILNMDPQWKRLLGLPFDMVARVLDILPGLFVVGGIFGTFIAIAHALPMVGKIDLGKIQESAPVLTAFIDNVALSMRCSITGIFCSVIMTILNALFPLTASRQGVQHDLQRSLEMIWRRIHGSELSFAEHRMIQLLESIEKLLGGTTGAADQGGQADLRRVS